MATSSIDIEPLQVVHWLRDERRKGRLPVHLRATRAFEVEESVRRIDDIGGDAAEPLTVVTAIGVLEITPPPGRNGWVLTIRVEDEIGPRTPEDEQTPEGEEEIDLDAFNADFIVPGRGTAFTTVDTEDGAALARFEAFLQSVSTNVHPQ